MDSQSEERICAHVVISGRVQGVGYRFFTHQQARNLKIKGWVRNLPNSGVEAVFEGDRASVDKIIYWCRTGPPEAVVKDISVKFCPSQGRETFEIIYW
ncbi:acylphosphatase [Gloeocapsa sp. PCC 73106]|uniref:acylphosphatase n=1 Tax=Gloeocapsa sp. PCC 73106 TaxID=102232 RepID=UPI0002AC159D|nr:acylphosphatase [Gloeocapsa sp. PCC 73106]ELR98967.1 acylphosphatase [Gloeocapsa sp. PCC 73106]